MKYFGTDGFRGEANVGLTVEHAYKIGRFVGWYYGANRGAKARVIVGKDTRRSSYMFEAALVSGLVASGADAYMLHVIPTPGVAHQTVEGCFDCGIMISASHNPFCDNGIKLVNSDGFKMDEDVLELIEDYIDGKSEVPLATGNHIGATVDYMQGRNRYIASLIASANFSLQGVKIGLDCANGSASSVAKPVFDALGADVRVINAAPDGFNINVDCGSTHMERLQRHVVEQGLDVGFAYDGDADRCLAVDERGRVVDGDQILYVCGVYLNKHGRLSGGTVVPTIASNFGLIKSLELAGLSAVTSGVGDRHVYAYADPNYRFSISSNLTWKNLSLSFVINSVQGGNGYYMAENPYALNPNAYFPGRMNMVDMPYWTPERPSNKYPTIDYSPTYGHYFLQDRSFVRLQDLSIAYDFPKRILNKIGMSGLRAYVSGKNLFTVTDWVGYDPEAGQSVFNGTPSMRSYILGIDITF